MTELDWSNVEVGDHLVDPHTGKRREVLAVSRVSGKRGQRGTTRTVVTVPNLRNRRWKGTTSIWSTEGARARCLVLEKKAMIGAIEFRDPGDEQPERKAS